jgi:hypothetical protein
VTLAPAGTVIELLSKARFLATRFTVTGTPGVVVGGVVVGGVVEVGGVVVVDGGVVVVGVVFGGGVVVLGGVVVCSGVVVGGVVVSAGVVVGGVVVDFEEQAPSTSNGVIIIIISKSPTKPNLFIFFLL